MKKHIFILILILTLGAGLRLCNIGWGLPDSTHRWPYHVDESLELECLKSMNPAIGDFSPHNFAWGSFYTYSLGFWLKSLSVLGVITTVNSEDFYRANIGELTKIYLSGRIYTVLLGITSILLLYFLGKLFYGRGAGLMAAFFAAILPFGVIHSHFMTPHIQFAAFCLLALIFCGLLLKDNRLWWYVLFGVSTGLAIGTYLFPGAILIVALMASHHLRCPEKGFRIFTERNFIIAIGVTIFAFFVSSPYVFLAPGEFISEWKYYHGRYFPFGMENIFNSFFKILPYGFGKYLFWLSVAGALFAALKNKKEDKVLLIWAGVYYLAVVFLGGGTFIRRFSPLVYIAVLFAARLVIAVMDTLADRKFLKTCFQVLLGLIILHSLFYTLALLHAMSAQDTRTLGYRWVNENIPSGSKIAISDYFLRIPHLDITRYKIIHSDKKDEEPDHQYYIDNFPVAEKGYVLMKLFVERPAFLGLVFDDTKAPRDMRHPNPDIYIYRHIIK